MSWKKLIVIQIAANMLISDLYELLMSLLNWPCSPSMLEAIIMLALNAIPIIIKLKQ